jgi:putative hydrolase of the HAD superfamily
MIKAIFFDFYNTLVRFWPPIEQIQRAACQEFGLNLSEEGIKRGYSVADVYFNRENELSPLTLRSEEDRLEFFSRYEQIILGEAGVPVSQDLARRIWQMASSVPKEFTPFEDTSPALSQLQADGYCLGIITNLRRDMKQICQRIGLSQYLDIFINSEDVGVEKPGAPMFLAALQQATVAPEEAVHVGDQHRSDVLGARAVGIHPVLIDRGGWHTDVNDCTKIASLAELAPVLAGAPHSLNSFNHHGSA